MRCPTCGQAHLIRDTRDLHHSYRGRSTLILAVTGDFCPACGECITGPEESRSVMDQMLRFKRQVDAVFGLPASPTRRDR
ncbi:type II toxin-antitoxin system MqsA family antitoxin [Cupriavidus necator]|uniref:type II toxin-antitoxin system MqsA family antitoxin n=1 Tax=Cupriavidus necator TaxID=106590 RepID=UPI00339D534B